MRSEDKRSHRVTFNPEELLRGQFDCASALEAILCWLEDRKAAGEPLPFGAIDLASVLMQMRYNRSKNHRNPSGQKENISVLQWCSTV